MTKQKQPPGLPMTLGNVQEALYFLRLVGGRWRAASRFRDGLYTTKAAASAATPPKKYLRTDYCRKNHEPGCYGHLFTLASGGSLVVVC
jgi:hypothetical protein